MHLIEFDEEGNWVGDARDPLANMMFRLAMVQADDIIGWHDVHHFKHGTHLIGVVNGKLAMSEDLIDEARGRMKRILELN